MASSEDQLQELEVCVRRRDDEPWGKVPGKRSTLGADMASHVLLEVDVGVYIYTFNFSTISFGHYDVPVTGDQAVTMIVNGP